MLKGTHNFPFRAEIVNWGNFSTVHVGQGLETFMGVLGLGSRDVGGVVGEVWESVRFFAVIYRAEARDSTNIHNVRKSYHSN